MNVLVTGATGFVGQNLIPLLLENGHSIIILLRTQEHSHQFDWFDRVQFVYYDIHKPTDNLHTQLKKYKKIDALVHLAWGNLPNYSSLVHFEESAIYSYLFIKQMIVFGIKQVLVSGTCLEYGFKAGSLSESDSTDPSTPYGFAKDSLRRALEFLSQTEPFQFRLQWLRLFYTFGVGQNPKSLLSQLQQAIANNEDFNMSLGEQLRDYLPIENVVKYIMITLENSNFDGVLNICKGTPISVRHLVEQKVEESGVDIKLNLGHYPYQSYEPIAFWGDNKKLKTLLV
jgi:nucleoside-diphosphate-sugar epimerase